MQKESILLKGNIINPLSLKKCRYIPEGYVLFSRKSGIITDYGRYVSIKDQNLDNFEIIDAGKDYILPAFTDMHTHIPQFPIRGIGKSSLLYWLDNYVREAEIRFCDKSYASGIISEFFDSLISSGTVTFCAYSNGSIQSTEIIFEAAEKKGIRLICGNVLGDLGGFYCRNHDPKAMIMESAGLIKKWHGRENRLFYALTPRFALFCSFEFMKKIAMIYDNSLYLQTHLSENRNEINEVLRLHSSFRTYTDIYNSAGLMKKHTILAHCIYLNDHEIDAIRDSCSIIAHCPTSNRFLRSGIMPLRKYIEKGLHIGLGTDIAGGYNISVIDELREAIEQSKTLSVINDEDLAINCREGIYLACGGSAEALKLSRLTGYIDKGKYADLVIIKNKAEQQSDIDRALSEIIYKSHDVVGLYCAGKCLL